MPDYCLIYNIASFYQYRTHLVKVYKEMGMLFLLSAYMKGENVSWAKIRLGGIGHSTTELSLATESLLQ